MQLINTNTNIGINIIDIWIGTSTPAGLVPQWTKGESKTLSLSTQTCRTLKQVGYRSRGPHLV